MTKPSSAKMRVKNAIRLFNFPGLILMVIILTGCAPKENQTEKKVEEIRLPGRSNNAELIRNPLSADESIDSTSVPKLVFDYTEYDFGDISDQKIVSHSFSFTNAGKTPLVIAHVRGTCGCTVPHWPEEPVPPGGTGSIEVRFDPSGKSGLQSKPVVITANTLPNTTNLSIIANIISK